MKPVIALIYLLVFYLSTQALPNHVTVYNANQGITSNYVYNSYADKSGTLWVGTETGLYYFDGKRFQPVDIQKSEFGKESKPFVFQGMCEDEEGNMFFGTFDHGLYVLDKQKKTFQRIHLGNTPNLKSNQICDLRCEEGVIYIFNAKGIIAYKYPKGVISASSDTSAGIRRIRTKNILYEIHETHVHCIQGKNKRTISLDYSKNFITDADTIELELYVSGKSGVNKIQNNQFLKQQITCQGMNLSDDYFLGIGSMLGRKYLLSYNHGLCWIDRIQSNQLICHLAEENNKTGIYFTAVSKDIRNQTLIVSTNQGIRIYPFHTASLQKLNLPTPLSSSVVCMQKNNRGYLVGTHNGLLQYDTVQHAFIPLSKNEYPKFVNTIYPLPTGFLIASHDGFHFLDHQKLTPAIPDELKSYHNFPVQGMIEYADGKIMFYDHHTNTFLFWDRKQKKVSLHTIAESLGIIHAVVQLNENQLLFAGRGLYTYDLNQYTIQKVNRPVFNDIFFTDLVRYKETIYASTFSSGVLLLNPKTLTPLKQIQTEQGLLSNAIYNLQLGQKGIWYSSAKGLGRIPFTNDDLNNFVPSEGFHDNNFDFFASNIVDGKILFGQKDGLVLIDEATVEYKEHNPEIRIVEVGLTKFGTYKRLPFSDENITLKHHENSLLFRLVSGDYQHPEFNDVYYRVNAGSWIPVGSNQIIQLNELPIGHFELEFTHFPFKENAKSNSKIHLNILPPWYRTWWFYILVISLTGFLITVAIRYYYRNRLAQQKLIIDKLHAVNKERERISADIHDDMGGNVAALQMITSTMLKINKPEEQQQSTEELQYHAVQLSQKIKDIVWATRTENDSLESLLLYIRQYTIRQLDPLGFDIQVKLPDHIPDQVIPGEKRKNIFYVVKEAINNIIKHSQATQVKMDCYVEDNVLHLSCSDNGVGLPDTIEHGNGLKLMQKRITPYQGEVRISNLPNHGVLVHLTVPV